MLRFCQQAQLMPCLRDLYDSEFLIEPSYVTRLRVVHSRMKLYRGELLMPVRGSIEGCTESPASMGPDDEVINLHFRGSITAAVICGPLPQLQGLEHPGV